MSFDFFIISNNSDDLISTCDVVSKRTANSVIHESQ